MFFILDKRIKAKEARAKGHILVKVASVQQPKHFSVFVFKIKSSVFSAFITA